MMNTEKIQINSSTLWEKARCKVIFEHITHAKIMNQLIAVDLFDHKESLHLRF